MELKKEEMKCSHECIRKKSFKFIDYISKPHYEEHELNLRNPHFFRPDYFILHAKGCPNNKRENHEKNT